MNQTGPVATIDSHKDLETTVAIIVSGFSGLGMAIQLRAEPGALPSVGQSCTAYVRASDLTILTR